MLSERKEGKKKLFFQNSTKAFKNIMLKYQKNEKAKNMNHKKLLLKRIESKLKNVQNKEKENEFIVKEVRSNIELKKKLISSFGIKALNHYEDSKNMNIKIKLEKSKLFNPLFDYNSNKFNISKKGNSHQKYNSHKIIKFPKIIDKKENNYSKKKNILKLNLLDNSISAIKINEYSFDNKNDVSEMENNKSNDSLSIRKYIVSNKKNKEEQEKKENNLYRCDTSNNLSEKSKINFSSNIFPNIIKTPLITERINSTVNKKKLNFSLKKKNRVFNLDYLNDIQNIREKLLLEEKRNHKFFENNQYGCDNYKIKYKYIKEKYFC